ncbi:GGDEF domain-containing protein [Kineococcus sp. GCM10028916]|uniref:GGDEF domain-containing protein n=1 Tax=Kineococcus sp. GCM10028916 TaxID=3273394 RepID=UPI003629BD65
MTPHGASPDWRALAAGAPATALLLGSTVQWASPGLAEFVLIDPRALVGTDALDLVLAADRPRARAALSAVREPGQRSGPLRLRPAARPEVRLELVARARAANHLVVAAWDVSHRLAVERELGHRASHDHLTGLPDRALLADRWGRSRSRVQADPALATFVLLCDVDGLKEVNDGLGHRAGDALLVEVARRLAAEVRPSDTVARLGGDEFVVLVEAVPSAHVEALAHRLRRSIAVVQAGVHVRLSVGWAADDLTRTTEAVLAEAETRMYEDKRAGRSIDLPGIHGTGPHA